MSEVNVRELNMGYMAVLSEVIRMDEVELEEYCQMEKILQCPSSYILKEHRIYFGIKRVADVVLSLMALFILSP